MSDSLLSILGQPSRFLCRTYMIFVWRILKTDYFNLNIKEKIDALSFSTFVGSTISSNLRLYGTGVVAFKDKNSKNSSIFCLLFDGQAYIYARVRFCVLNKDGRTLYGRDLLREKILKKHSSKISTFPGIQCLEYFNAMFETRSPSDFLCVSCEFTFDSDDCDQLRQLPYKQLLYKQMSLHDSFQLRFNEFDEFEKLLSEPRFADVSFQVANDDREPLLAHRNILSARSPVFEAMFAHEMLENKQSRVNIEDISYDVLKVFLRYLYIAKLPENLGLDMLAELLIAAEKYNIEGLKTRCEIRLCNELTPENALNFLSLADTHNANKLRARCFAFIEAKSETIQELVRKNLKK